MAKYKRDRGYVSQKLAAQLLEELGIESSVLRRQTAEPATTTKWFFAKPRRDMKNKLMRLHDKLLSRKRSIIETINDPSGSPVAPRS